MCMHFLLHCCVPSKKSPERLHVSDYSLGVLSGSVEQGWQMIHILDQTLLL